MANEKGGSCSMREEGKSFSLKTRKGSLGGVGIGGLITYVRGVRCWL
jgi:hypothetical protein